MSSNLLGVTSGTVPLGPLQDGLWLFWRLDPTSSVHAMPEVFHYEGEFDVDAAVSAFSQLVAPDGRRAEWRT